MSETWPVTMPQAFDIPGYNEGVSDNLAETQPEVGPPITRLRSTSAVRPISGNMTCTEDQIRTFKTFFYDAIMGGALPFTFPEQISPAIGMLVKFPKGSLPRWSPLGGGYWRLNMTLMVLP